jgi:hypothetical protein
MDDQFLNTTLEYTDARRRRFIDQIETENKGVIPTDPDSARLYLKALSDMDSSAVSHARVKTEEKATDNDASVAEIIRDVVRKLDGRNPYKTEEPDASRPLPSLPTEVEASVTVDESLMETGKVQESVEEFNRRMGLDDD